MVADVRKLLENYNFNISHDVIVSGEGTTDESVFRCDTKGLHVGDVSEKNGKISLIEDGSITLEKPFTEDVTSIKISVYDYVSDEWLNDTWEYQVKPIVSLYVPIEEITTEEYHDGAFNEILVLDHRYIKEVISIEGGYYTSIDHESGILKGFFPKGIKNIRVKYTYGAEMNPEIKRACVLLLASFALGFIGGSTGGGSLNVQGYGRNYGSRGKYTDTRQEFDRWAYSILQKYSTGMVQI